ncbi:AMP-binding protein [Novosphingobium sp.]|uniref:AMP-binding protein n=1 Tax=Novosphingobium sp. TaxID=1874826 RepID=UPI00286E83E0|nr:AMP-binding protein [Novosphingobium sp.]
MIWKLRQVEEAAVYRANGVWLDRTLADDARDWAERDSLRDIFIGGDRPITCADVLSDAENLSAALQELGIQQGDCISLMVPNWPEAGVVNLAAALMGFVINPIVPIYRDAETRFILRDCRSRAMIIPTSFRGFDYAAMLQRIAADLPELRHIITMRGTSEGTIAYEDLLESGKRRPTSCPNVDPDGLKMVMYTSGTTGAPKAVLHSHNTLARAVHASAAHWAIGSDDVVLMPSPVTHVSGYSNGLERPFQSGTQTVLMESWNADQAVTLIDRYNCSMTVAATPFLQELVDAAERNESRLPSFRVFACGGAAVPPELIEKANRSFAHACAFRVYGSSEAPFVTLGATPTDPPEMARDTDGRVVDYQVRLIGEDGKDTAEGEIIVKGPALFLGYGDPEQTAESFTDDGYFTTGDIGRFDENGGLVITGRKKDLIIRGGENISPKEIEDALHRHPEIIEAAVVSAPHPRLGEGVFAFLILREGCSASVDELGTFLTGQGLARQKCPERIAVVDDFPRTASGKVRKDQLRALIS